MLEIFTWSVFITGLFFTSFGIFAYLRNPHATTTRMFGLLSIAFAIWSYSWFGMLLSKSYESALFFAKLLNFGATLIPIFYLSWVVAVVGFTRPRKIILVIGYVITIIFGILSFTDLYVSDVRPILDFPYWPVGGPAYFIYVIIGYFGFILYSVWELLKKFFRSSGVEKYQIGYLLLGALLGFGGGATNFLPMFGVETTLPIYGVFLTMSSPFVFSYAAIRYNLMEIKVVAVQFFAGVLNLIFLINLILSNTSAEKFFNSLLLGMVFLFSILLVRSVMQEIRTRREIEILAKNLEQANVRLKELDRLKSEFLSFATHQLRSPLTAIKGYASLVLEGSYGMVPVSIKEAAGRIFESAQGLTKIVEDFLNISRIEQGKMKYEFAETDLGALTKEVGEELKPNVEKSGLTLSFKTDGKASYKARVDIGKTRQIIGNLIDNAIKYGKSGDISVFVKSPIAGLVRIEIKDMGVGIDKETMERLFQKFSRASDANASNTSGTGLGLYVAKEMATGQGGRLWAESEGRGKGSTFIVEFPGLS